MCVLYFIRVVILSMFLFCLCCFLLLLCRCVMQLCIIVCVCAGSMAPQLKEQMESLPELYKELMGEDEKTGMVWMPNTINLPMKGMIFADGSNASQWAWAAVQSTHMTKEEKAKHKAKGKDYEYKMDMETMKHYPEGDFMDALEYIGIFKK